MRRAWLLAAFALGAGAGFLLRPAVAPAASPTVTRLVQMAPPVGAAGAGLTIEDVRAAVRAELTAGAPPATSPPADEPPPPPPVPAPAAAATESRVDAALAAGRWRNEDRLALFPLLAELPASDRDRLLQRLAAAINDGSLRVETDGPPF